MSGERRMEAENYLADGYGIRLAFKSKTSGWKELRHLVSVRQPGRLKGILVSRDYGTPFLAATQVFDLRPQPRKWLSVDRIESPDELFVKSGLILVTRSGSVGRSTLACKVHEGLVISDDLLRLEAKQELMQGWAYAYLRSSHARAMMVAARYGHIIKHLEVSHLDELPFPVVRDALAKEFGSKLRSILRKRDRAYELFAEAEELFTQSAGLPKTVDIGESGFSIDASMTTSGRRRLDGFFHNPAVRAIKKHFARFETIELKKAGLDIWLPSRFKRVPAKEGVEFVDSSDLFEVSPDITKRIADGDFGDRAKGRVTRGWLLLARSGQIYGINGSVILANEAHEGRIISDHIIRIAPNEQRKVRIGYIYVVLAHPQFGRPLLKSLAYGSSIPEIEPQDVERVAIPRLAAKLELHLSELAEKGAKLLAEADLDESAMSTEADKLVQRFLAGDTKDFVLIGNGRH